METLNGKNILLVGATGGIGSKLAKLLAGSGANLFLAARNEGKLQEVAVMNNISPERITSLDIAAPAAVQQLKEK
jgi:short-subunit dehydrogenase